MKSIKEISELILNTTSQTFAALKEELRDDTRKGVIKEIEKRENYFKKREKMIEQYKLRQRYEISLFNRGVEFIAGIDEVGRGPLAGPVYAAVVILDKNSSYLGVKDSKKLSQKQREELYEKIKSTAIAYSIGSATSEEIDQINILNATKLAMKRALESMEVKPQHLLIDALKLDVNIPQTSIIKGDDMSISIGAASILAKVERDRYMEEISKKYPYYSLEKNKGYGTPEHIEGLKLHGPCEIHRWSFIKNILGEV